MKTAAEHPSPTEMLVWLQPKPTGNGINPLRAVLYLLFAGLALVGLVLMLSTNNSLEPDGDMALGLGAVLFAAGGILLVMVYVAQRTKHHLPVSIRLNAESGHAVLESTQKEWTVRVPLIWVQGFGVVSHTVSFGRHSTHPGWYLMLYFKDGGSFILAEAASDKNLLPLQTALTDYLLQIVPAKPAKPAKLSCGLKTQDYPGSGRGFFWKKETGARWWALMVVGITVMIIGLITTALDSSELAPVWMLVAVAGGGLAAWGYARHLAVARVRAELGLSALGAVADETTRPGVPSKNIRTLAKDQIERIVLIPQRGAMDDAGGVIIGTASAVESMARRNFLQSNRIRTRGVSPLPADCLVADFDGQPPLLALQLWVSARFAAQDLGIVSPVEG